MRKSTMATTQILVQENKFDAFYPTAVTYLVNSKLYILLQEENKERFNVHSINSSGEIELGYTIQTDNLKLFYNNMNVIEDIDKSKQYLFGINVEKKRFDLYKIQSNGHVVYLNGYLFTNATDLQTATFYILDSVLYYYLQERDTKKWKIHKYITE